MSLRRPFARPLILAAVATSALALVLLMQAALAQASPLNRPRAATIVPAGTLTSNTTWTVAGSPYLVQGALNVGSGYVLTIEPGVTVKFTGTASLTVLQDATLIAEGTITQPVTFTSAFASPEAGDWVGLDLTRSAHVRLAYCDIGYAGNRGQAMGVYIYTPSDTFIPDIVIQRCRIHDHAGKGLWVDGDVEMALTIEDTRFDHNGGPGLVINWPKSTPSYRNLTFDHNSVDGLYYDGDFNRNVFKRSLTFDGPALNGSPIILANEGSFVVPTGVTVTVEPGTTVHIAPKAFETTQWIIQAGGTLLAEGTPANPITITSGLTTPAAGNWWGLDFRAASRGRLSDCTIRYAGGGGGPNAVVAIAATDVQVRRCHFHNNLNKAIYTSGNAQPVLLYNQFEGGTHGVFNSTPATVVDARANWWGHASGPQHPTLNPGGQGTAVTDGVLFDPWLESTTAATLFVWPNQGGNTGKVTVNLIGGPNVESATTVKLMRDGQSDIVGVLHAPETAGDPLQVTFDLDGAATGAWSLAATGPGGTDTLPDGFSVEAGLASHFWFNLINRPAVGVNRPTEVVLVYGNTANVDAPAAWMRVIVPMTLTIVAEPEVPYLLRWSDEEQVRYLDFYVPRVPAQSIIAVPFRVKAEAVGNLVLGLRARSPASDDVDLGSLPMDPSTTLSVTSLVTTTTSLSATIHLSSDTDNGDLHFSMVQLDTPAFIDGPIVTKTVTGGIVRYEILSTLPSAALSGLHGPVGAGEDISFETAVWYPYEEDFGSVGDKILEALQKIPEEVETTSEVETKGGLLGCLFKNNPELIDTFLNPAEDANEATQLVGPLAKLMQGLEAFMNMSANLGPMLQSMMGQLQGGVEQYMSGAVDGGVPNPLQPGEAAALTGTMDDVGVVCKFEPPQDHPLDVRTSMDPNEKVGPAGAGIARYITGDEPLAYTIYFENLITATAPAQVVVITDVLDADLDWSTLQFGAMSFGDRSTPGEADGSAFSADIDLRPGQDLIVRASASFDEAAGVVTWEFTSRDPATGELPEDPDNGFLPPNTDGNGQGSVFYTIQAQPGLPSGREIRNRASIVFDLNAPLETNEWLNTIDAVAPQSAVSALPATFAGRELVVSWSGSDSGGGSGVADYVVYVSVNGGPFEPWLSHTSATSAVYYVRTGGAYAFYSRARDGAGNTEAAPGGADTATTVTVPSLHLPFITR